MTLITHSVRVAGLALLMMSSWAGAQTFNLVATHPEVAAQTTYYGNKIATLEPFNGKLYAGYGDYGANTGPIAIRAYDPTIGDFTSSFLTMASEAVYVYRPINGKLYAPNIDTRGGGTGYAVGTAGSPDTWQDLLPFAGIHMFDANTFTGADVFMAGVANNGDGMVWRSTDDGASWTESLRMPAGVGGKGQTQNIDVRIYGLGLYQGKLYADVEQLYTATNGAVGARSGGQSAPSMVFDGTTWTEGPKLTPYGFASNMEEFADTLLYQDFHAGITSSDLMGYDGKRVTQIYNPKGKNAGVSSVFDFAIDNGLLYVLAADGQISTTADLKDWALLATAPSDARSIGILDDMLYVGGVGGVLYEYDTPLSALALAPADSFAAVPEPTSAVMLVVGMVTIARRRRNPCASHDAPWPRRA